MGAISRKALLAGALVVALLAVPIVGCTSDSGSSSDGGDKGGDPYKIGVVVSLTGTYSGLGDAEKKAIEMEVERINADGGVHDRDIEVVFEDDATDEAQAQSAAEKLVQQDKVLALIGASGTGQSMAMRTAAQDAGVPQISMAGGTVITSEFDPLVFQTPWSNTLVVPYLLDYLNAQGQTKIALISDTGGFAKDGVAVMESMVADYGVEVVASEVFNPGDTDMTTQLTKIKGSGADALVVWSAGKEAAIVLNNAAALDLGMPIYGSHGNARQELIDGAGAAAEGFIFPAGKVLVPASYGEGTPGYEVATSFIDRYTEKYDAAPSTFAGHAYDALYLVVEAMKRLPEDFTSEDLRAEIEKTSGFVGIGGTFTFSTTDHNGMSSSDLVLYKVENGTWTVMQ